MNSRSFLFAPPVAVLASLFWMPNRAAAVPVTVTVTKVDAVGDNLEGIGRGEADFYAGVVINGITFDSFAGHPDDDDHIEPFWSFSTDVPDGTPTVNVSIAIWEHDDCDHPFCDDTGIFESNDDHADVTPSGATRDVSLTIDMATGKWTGPPNWPANCSTGTGDEAATVCWEISTQSASGDADGDGLLDGWERNGFDADNDGSIDVDLPAMGAQVLRKDLFLELDWTAGQNTNRAGIQGMKTAFANAPLGNPDGSSGVNLWVDTGTLVDPAAAEDGGPPNSCSDGVNNGGPDGADGADPDCLVGDNLGGGNLIPPFNTCQLDSGFYTAKGANFNANRRWIFRYAISTQQASGCTGSGGQGEIGGNDFTEFNHDGGTIMHELGHTLNLRHGGNVNNNCKPDYVSVMNYDLQFGIPQAGGGSIFDYSPPRFAGGRGIAPLPNLVENALNEGTILDATDATNRFVFVNGLGQKVQNPLNAFVDWTGDGDTADNPVTVNIDTTGTNGRPAACANGASNSTLSGFGDWSAVSLPFRQFGDSADGAINPETELPPTLQDLQILQAEINTTDLILDKSDDADPAVAGTNLVYTLSVTNAGPNPSPITVLSDTLPAGVTFVSADDPGCVEGPAGSIHCDLGEIAARASREVKLTVAIAADLVHNAGAPVTLTNNASVENHNCPYEFGGVCPDSNVADNTASETTKVVAVADLKIVSFGAVTPPSEVIVAETVPITLRKVMTNLGPSAPMDVRVIGTATPPSGATVTPSGHNFLEAALALNELRNVDEAYSLTCNEASHHLFTFANSIAPDRPDDTDPDLTNNAASIVLDIECVVPVKIEIKPGSNPAPIYLDEGSIPVTVLSTAAGEYGLPLAFNAMTIDPLSVRFGLRSLVQPGLGGAPEIHGKGHPTTATQPSGFPNEKDMVLHFRASETGLVPGTTEACIKGTWIDASGNSHKFFGCDEIRIVPR